MGRHSAKKYGYGAGGYGGALGYGGYGRYGMRGGFGGLGALSGLIPLLGVGALAIFLLSFLSRKNKLGGGVLAIPAIMPGCTSCVL